MCRKGFSASLALAGALLATTGLALAMEVGSVNLVDPDGVGVSAPMLIPTSRVAPAYPAAALAARYDGTVTLRVSVLRDGSVGPTEVLDSSRLKLGFEEAANRAVERWHFEPAQEGGQPVDSYTLVRFRFRPPASRLEAPSVAADFIVPSPAIAIGAPLAPAVSGVPLAGAGNYAAAVNPTDWGLATYGRPPCVTGCLYNRAELIPPPNYNIHAHVSGSPSGGSTTSARPSPRR